MASVIAYYRPRGIAGNYKVGILLELLPTEEAKIIRWQTKGTLISPEDFHLLTFASPQPEIKGEKPVKTSFKQSLFKKDQRKIEIYVLSRVNFHPDIENIMIEIHDVDISEFQINGYETTETEIVGGLREEMIEFSQITLVDLDLPYNPQLQQFKSEIRQLQQFMQ